MDKKAALRVKTADGKWVMVPALITAGESVTFDPKDAGKLVYISQDGTLIPLELGFGLEIKDGKLEVTDRQIVRAICGTFRSGEAICGEV